MSRLRNALKLLALSAALIFVAALPESLRITRNLAGLLF
jgi:hypothetical protein